MPDGYDATNFGDTFAEVYDDWHAMRDDGGAVADLLVELAGSGRVLELGVGTGRLALLLVERGVDVAGVEASRPMADRLRAKPGGDAVPVTIGDFADVPVPGPFQVVYLAFSSLFLLPDQARQVECFANVASRLAPGGRFVLDAFVPDVGRYARDQSVTVEAMDTGSVRLDVSRHDPVDQVIVSTRVVLDGGVRLFPYRVRYAYPAEMDLMATVAGLDREARYGDYRRGEFTASSTSHVTVYRKPADGR